MEWMEDPVVVMMEQNVLGKGKKETNFVHVVLKARENNNNNTKINSNKQKEQEDLKMIFDFLKYIKLVYIIRLYIFYFM